MPPRLLNPQAHVHSVLSHLPRVVVVDIVAEERLRDVAVDGDSLHQFDILYAEPALVGAVVAVRQFERDRKHEGFHIFRSNRSHFAQHECIKRGGE